MNNNTGRMVLGSLLIAAGVIIFGNLSGYWHFNLFFAGWWTLFLIVPGVISMVESGINFGNALLVMMGALFLLGQQGVIDHDRVFKLLFPLILIMLGIFVFIGTGRKNSIHANPGNVVSDDSPNYMAVFSSNELNNTSQHLQGGTATAIFGNLVIDLHQTRVDSDITFNTTVIFGSVKISAPGEVRVKVTGIPIFGRNEVKCLPVNDDNLPLVTLNCITLFGNTEVK